LTGTTCRVIRTSEKKCGKPNQTPGFSQISRNLTNVDTAVQRGHENSTSGVECLTDQGMGNIVLLEQFHLENMEHMEIQIKSSNLYSFPKITWFQEEA
jgi:hypothetical protein